MNLKRLEFKTAGGWTELFFLLVFYYFGLILASFIVFACLGRNISESVSLIRISQFIQAIFVFIIPAIACTILFRGPLLAHSKPSSIKMNSLVLGVLLIILAIPSIEWINSYNELIQLPESMSSLSDFFAQTKRSSERVLNLLFTDKSLLSVLMNILVIALLAGISEEIFFRGCLQNILLKLAKNVHVAIWLSATIFSAAHFQLEGFFVRILLGALLGYIYFWTKSIWIPIIIHAVYNTIIVVYQQIVVNTDLYKKIIRLNEGVNIEGIAIFASIVLSLATLCWLKRATR